MFYINERIVQMAQMVVQRTGAESVSLDLYWRVCHRWLTVTLEISLVSLIWFIWISNKHKDGIKLKMIIQTVVTGMRIVILKLHSYYKQYSFLTGGHDRSYFHSFVRCVLFNCSFILILKLRRSSFLLCVRLVSEGCPKPLFVFMSFQRQKLCLQFIWWVCEHFSVWMNWTVCLRRQRCCRWVFVIFPIVDLWVFVCLHS